MKKEISKIRRILIYVAYDGTDYHGWQYQPGPTTIEGKLNEALTELLKEDIKVIGASRTDAGVHALGNLAVFDTISKIPAEKFPYAINAKLPDDIRVIKGMEVGRNFHPRKCDTRKTYAYNIINSKFDIPIKSRYSYHIDYKLNLDNMRKAAHVLEGEHDFTSFCSVNTQSESHVRTIYSISVNEEFKNDYSEIVLYVTGNGFLYNMVRIIAGTLIDVGRGKISLDDMILILEAKDRTKAGHTAPAKALTLVKYEFDNLNIIKNEQ